ncbi:acetyltransferase [Herbaspirillum rhizosphaerae]|uniref:acetyltransferase n=1 Tax=Herbaspirillum rhizosphaerae TaxID=346179 RepID=UPI00067D6195|nr:acetyltransferase [Herbaspirillum rhizosphaerae]
MTPDIIILGAGGHARVLLKALAGATVLGLTDPDPAKAGGAIAGIPILGTDDALKAYAVDKVVLVNGIGSVGSNERRRDLFARYKQIGYAFLNVCHPSAVVADDVLLGEGVQIMAGAILQTGCSVGENSIVNTGAVVDHDCGIGRHVHIAPGAVLSGGVEVGDNAHVGAGATVIQGVRIGANSLVGAGAVVVRDVPPGVRVAGVPAKEIR